MLPRSVVAISNATRGPAGLEQAEPEDSETPADLAVLADGAEPRCRLPEVLLGIGDVTGQEFAPREVPQDLAGEMVVVEPASAWPAPGAASAARHEIVRR